MIKDQCYEDRKRGIACKVLASYTARIMDNRNEVRAGLGPVMDKEATASSEGTSFLAS